MRKAYLSILTAAFLWGCIGIFLKLLTAGGLSSMQSVAVRVTLAAIIYTVYLFFTDRSALKIKLRHIPYFIGTGIVSLAFFNWCYFNAIAESSMAVAAVLLYTSPIFALLLSAVLFKEKLTPMKLIALVLTFIGCMLVTGIIGSGGTVSLSALLFGLGSGFGYALYSIFGKFALRHYSPSTVTAYTFIFAAVGVLPMSGIWKVGGALLSPEVIFGGLGISVLCCIIPYLIYTYGLAHVETGKAAIIATLEPVVASVIGIVFFKEGADIGKICGIALVVGSIMLLNVNFGKKRE